MFSFHTNTTLYRNLRFTRPKSLNLIRKSNSLKSHSFDHKHGRHGDLLSAGLYKTLKHIFLVINGFYKLKYVIKELYMGYNSLHSIYLCFYVQPILCTRIYGGHRIFEMPFSRGVCSDSNEPAPK